MARHLFIAQQTLSTWMDQDKIDFDGDIMTIRADGRQFKLVEAVRFIRVEGDDEDINDLLGKVKTDQQLEELGAERYRDSVIYGDIAYKAQEGFIGEVFLNRLDAELRAEPEVLKPKAKAPRPIEPMILQPKARAPRLDEPQVLKPKAKAPRPIEPEPQVLKPKAQPAQRPLDVAQTQRTMPPVPEDQRELSRSVTAASDPAAAKARKAGGDAGDKKEEELTDEELLTKFLLDNL